MFDLHLLVCVKVWNETQADPWETMQPLMSPGGLGVTVCLTQSIGGSCNRERERERVEFKMKQCFYDSLSSPRGEIYRHLAFYDLVIER